MKLIELELRIKALEEHLVQELGFEPKDVLAPTAPAEAPAAEEDKQDE